MPDWRCGEETGGVLVVRKRFFTQPLNAAFRFRGRLALLVAQAQALHRAAPNAPYSVFHCPNRSCAFSVLAPACRTVLACPKPLMQPKPAIALVLAWLSL